MLRFFDYISLPSENLKEVLYSAPRALAILSKSTTSAQ